MNTKITETKTHVLFWSSIFSNWARAEFKVNDITFYNSEQYFMYLKALTFKDDETAQLIIEKGKNPKEAKRLGRLVKNFDNTVWDKIKFQCMFEAVKFKFNANPDLKKELMSHGNRTFVEASPVDRIWGIGLAEDDPRADDESQWKGQNLLGKALTELRDSYIK